MLGFDSSNFPQRPAADFLGVYVGTALFFAAFLIPQWLARPAMVWLGAVSYSLYLLHPLVMQCCSWLASRAGSPFLAIAMLGAGFPLSLLAAHLAYRFVELPSIRLGHMLADQGTGVR